MTPLRRDELVDLIESLAEELRKKNRQVRGLMEFIRWLDPFGNARRAKETRKRWPTVTEETIPDSQVTDAAWTCDYCGRDCRNRYGWAAFRCGQEARSDNE